MPNEISQGFSQTKRSLNELLRTRQRSLRNTFGMHTPAAHQKLGVIRYSRQRPVVRAAIDQTGELRKVTL